MANTTRFNIPPRFGGGDFVLRELLAGELEDSMRRQGQATKDQAFNVVIDSQAQLILLTLEEFRGQKVPKGGVEGTAFWNGLTSGVRSHIIGIYDRFNNARQDEVDRFFAEAVPEILPKVPKT